MTDTPIDAVPDLIADGERMIPAHHAGTMMYAEHMSRYKFAAQFARGKRVLDVASGSGYGAELLKAAGASDVVGLDYNLDALAYSLRTHARGKPEFLAGDAQVLPFSSASFDLIVSFETLEHVPEPERMLSELRRVLRDDGILVVSTPNRGVYLEGNPFHLHEMTYDEFSAALAGLFPHVEILVQDNLVASSVFDAELMRSKGVSVNDGTQMFKTVARDPSECVYLIAVCSSVPLPNAMGQITLSSAAELDQHLRDLGQARYEKELQELNAAKLQHDLLHEHSLLIDEQSRLEAKLRQSQRALERVQEERDEAHATLASIGNSMGWRMLELYRRGIRRVAPANSIRGKPYRAAVSLLRGSLRNAGRARRVAAKSRRVIKDEGWRAFGRKARGRVIGRLSSKRVPTIARSITYEQWIAATEPDAAALQRQREGSKVLPFRPLVSIITPVWNPDPRLLRETIESVRRQTYDNWELCLADGGSTAAGVRETLAELASKDSKIRVEYLEKNLGISANTNAALGRAGGEYVAFLDHTDLLAPNALWEVVSQLNRDPSLACIYSDHDLISMDGKRYEPLFKPAWSPETMFSANFATHFCVMKASLVKELGGLRAEMDGAQDWDLLLRVSQQTDRFARIPKILYYWRSDPESTVSSASNKGYAIAAQDRALSNHLKAIGSGARVDRHASGGPQLRWDLDGATKISLIIATKHNRKVLAPCLRAIAGSAYRNFEVIVVDNGGQTHENENWYQSFAREFDLNVLWWKKPFNYSAVNNLGASKASGDVLLFLNDDTEATSPDWLTEMLGWVQHPGIGIVGAQLLWKNGRIQHGGDVLGMNGFADHLFTGANPYEWTLMGSPLWYRNVSAVTGACLMMRRDLFEQVGGFNEAFHLCGSDVELCLRVRRKGLRIVCTPFAGVLHHERATRGGYDDAADVYTSFWYYQSKLYGGDPYYNPNLSLLSTVPQLRHPEEPKPPEMVAPVIGRSLKINKQGAAGMEEEAIILAEACQITPGEVDATKRLHEANKAPFEVKSINWFIPDFESPFYGGIHTILRFADHFKREHGVANRFIVLASGPEPYIRSGIRAAFPSLGDCEIRVSGHGIEDIRALPYADVSIATLWITAFALSKFENTRRKFYMIQDFEAIFYPAGTLHALSEATYRLGMYGICNTHTLKNIYEAEYGGKGFGFDPAVDTSLFHPPQGPRGKGDTMTVFLYGRPGTWRNCWELAMSALRRLKQRTKKKIRVVTAGSWAPPPDSEGAYLIDNLGLLDYRDTAELYRTVDVGLTLSVSKHPSYLPLELMASGACVVSNINTAGSWLLKDGENCILAEPTAESLADALDTALNDDEMRERLSKNAVEYIQQNFADWPSRINAAYDYMCNPEGG
jgi:GT2 family glycosyltransferase/SAM-dependent methyltransferase/glycosyltransferase involved in cell wall biosynthesis